MTTTSMYSGLPGGERPSSRVRAPPGGRSNNIFGSPEPAPVATENAPKKENVRPISNVFGESAAPVSTPQHDNVMSKKGGSMDNVKSILFGADSTQQQVNAANMKKKRTGINPITGRRYEEEEEAEEEKKKAAAAAASTAPANEENKQVEKESKVEKPAAGIYTSSKVSQPPGGRSTRLW